MKNNITEQLNNAKELLENGSYREALQYFSAIFEENPNCADALFYKTECLFKIWWNEDFLIEPDAEKSCELYLKKFGDKCEVLAFLADINYLNGKYNKSLIYSKKALSIHPDYDWPLTVYGNTLTQLNCFEDAINIFDKMIIEEICAFNGINAKRHPKIINNCFRI